MTLSESDKGISHETQSRFATPKVEAVRELEYQTLIDQFFGPGASGKPVAGQLEALKHTLGFMQVRDPEFAAMVIARLKVHILDPQYRSQAPQELCKYIESEESVGATSVADVMKYFGFRVPLAMVASDPVGIQQEIIDETEKNILIDQCLSTLPCACFDDEPGLLHLSRGELIKIGCKGNNVEIYDTSRLIGKEDRFIPQFEIINRSKLIVSDCNDAGQGAFGIDKRLREGLKDPEKIFIIVSGVPENRELVDNEFKAEYGHRYVYLDKPYNYEQLKGAIRDLVWRNICKKE